MPSISVRPAAWSLALLGHSLKKVKTPGSFWKEKLRIISWLWRVLIRFQLGTWTLNQSFNFSNTAPSLPSTSTNHQRHALLWILEHFLNSTASINVFIYFSKYPPLLVATSSNPSSTLLFFCKLHVLPSELIM